MNLVRFSDAKNAPRAIAIDREFGPNLRSLAGITILKLTNIQFRINFEYEIDRGQFWGFRARVRPVRFPHEAQCILTDFRDSTTYKSMRNLFHKTSSGPSRIHKHARVYSVICATHVCVNDVILTV